MSWFKVDDRFHNHVKVYALPMAARGLWITAGSWCSSQLTDGHLPKKMVIALGARQRDADALVAAGLWEKTDDGYIFHDWLDYQPSREEAQEKKRSTAARVSNHRQRRQLVAELAARDGWSCRYCARELNAQTATFDHVQPLAKGGQNSAENLALSCRGCNSAKGDRGADTVSVVGELSSIVTRYSSAGNNTPSRPDPSRPVSPEEKEENLSALFIAEERRRQERARANDLRFEKAPLPPAPQLSPDGPVRTPEGDVWTTAERLRGYSKGLLGAPGAEYTACKDVAGLVTAAVGSDHGPDWQSALERLLAAWLADDFVKQTSPPLSNLFKRRTKYVHVLSPRKPVAKVDLSKLSDEEFFKLAGAS